MCLTLLSSFFGVEVNDGKYQPPVKVVVYCNIVLSAGVFPFSTSAWTLLVNFILAVDD